jgi:EKC/KEOPS complex subunit PCC1/LAGE3
MRQIHFATTSPIFCANTPVAFQRKYPANCRLRHSTLDVPFPGARLASVALQALRVDKELSSLVQRDFTVVAPDGSSDPSVLRVEYRATTNRMLRVAVNTFLESLALVVEVQEQLDVDVVEARRAQATSG